MIDRRVKKILGLNNFKTRIGLFLISIVLILPLIFLAVFNYQRVSFELTEGTLNEHRLAADLISLLIKERVDGLVGLGISLSTRASFVDLVARDKWSEAIKMLGGVPDDFPFIERVFLTNAKGVLLADIPEIKEVHGVDFSFRDWYQGVSKNWRPYVSEVYKRTAEPQFNVIAMAFPIKRDVASEILGILVLQIKL